MEKHFVSNKDESVRIFKNDYLESLSKVHFTIPLILYVPVVLYYLYKAIFIENLFFGYILLLFIAGIFAWTLAEYLIHRFIFHFHPSSAIGKRIHFMVHGVHHDYPNDSKRLVMVPSLSIPLAFFFYFLFYYTMGQAFTSAFYPGFVAGYLFYDTSHYALHHWNFKSKFWLNLKKHHMMHHYRDSENGFGVSSKFWDHVFKTMFGNGIKSIIFILFTILPLLGYSVVGGDANADPIIMGDKYFGQMRYRDAAAWYNLAASAEAQWKLARTYICYGDIADDAECESYYRKAEKAARRAVELDDRISSGHTYLAAALGNIAVFEGSKSKVRLCNEIKKELQRAIELNPNDDVAYSILGSFYRILGNISWVERQLAKAFIGSIPEGGYEDSERCLQKAIKLNPTTMRHWFELGLLYNDWGKEDKADQAFNKAQKLPVQIASDKSRLTRITQYLKD
jgi:sterol desaturase/sphingolipid hydroxylase (fatty acid hydroxylase superfamily)